MIVRRAQPWLGTLVEIVAEGTDATALNAAVQQAFGRISAVHASMSFQDEHSELTHVNRAAQLGWVALSPELATVFAAAIEMAHASDGLFDPSVAGHLVASGHLPSHSGTPAMPVTDWRAIELDGRRVRYQRPLLVDLSGIAKGYAVDAAVAMLRDAGLAAGTVNAGGDLAHFGDTPVPVHVRHPRQPTHALRLADLAAGAAATSADYFQPGALRHPADGNAVCGQSSITVLASTCLHADALTKVVAADAGRAPAVLARYGAQALVLDDAGVMAGDAAGWRWLPTEQAA